MNGLDKTDIVPVEANTGLPLKGDFERMAKRRFQNPKPFREGNWWVILVWQDEFVAGKHKRKRKWVKLAPATMKEREVLKLATEHLRPLNQGLESIGSATNFQHYVQNTYAEVVLPSMASSTRSRYEGVIKNYLLPTFGKLCMRDLTPVTLDRYFAQFHDSGLMHESVDKIRDVLASIITTAIRHKLLVENPLEGLVFPRLKQAKRNKPIVTPEQFEKLVSMIAEPYATMVYVAIYTGLRVSELAGLRWNDVQPDSITIDERYCRGDWGAPKSEASNATIGVNRCVIERVQRLKDLSVVVNWGGKGAKKVIRVVRSAKPDDLVFQSLKIGMPMRDNNILVRHLKPAGRKLGLDFVNWRCLRTSHATWLKMAGADVKDAQAQMRHSRASTTLDIYQQFVPESQKRVVNKLSSLSKMVQ